MMPPPPPRLTLLSRALQFRQTLSLVQSNCSRSNINEKRLMDALQTTSRVTLRRWQTRTHGCGHTVADTNVSPFVRARNICCGHKKCFLRNILRPQQMFASLRCPRNIMDNNVCLFTRASRDRKTNLMIVFICLSSAYFRNSNRGS